MRTLIAITAIALLASGIAAQTLSLKEKQAIAGLDFSWSEKRIKENCGGSIAISVDAGSFAGDMDAIQYADSRGAQVTANAFARICADNIGKEALQSKKIVRVVLRNVKTTRNIEIGGGTLTLTSKFGGSGDKDFYGEYDMKEAIENML